MKCYQGRFCLFTKKRAELVLSICCSYCGCFIRYRYQTYLFSNFEMVRKRFKPQYLFSGLRKWRSKISAEKMIYESKYIKTRNNIFVLNFSLSPSLSLSFFHLILYDIVNRSFCPNFVPSVTKCKKKSQGKVALNHINVCKLLVATWKKLQMRKRKSNQEQNRTILSKEIKF